MYEYLEGKLASDKYGGLIDVKHLAATVEGYINMQSPVPAPWFGWIGDLSTAMGDTEKLVSNSGGKEDYQTAANKVIGSDLYSFSYADICSDADAIKIAELIYKSTSTAHAFSESLMAYYESYADMRFTYYLQELKCMPNLTSLKNSIRAKMSNIITLIPEIVFNQFQLPSDDAIRAGCVSFSNYLYSALEVKENS